jgi:hypothetical protein
MAEGRSNFADLVVNERSILTQRPYKAADNI